MDHVSKTRQWLKGLQRGVEIGPFKYPIPGIAPAYVDCFEEYAHEPYLRDYEGSACDLPFRDSSLDYVASSHLLEHVANPIKALDEWGRTLRSGGIIYLVIPDRRRTWDRNRPLTAAEHMLNDFRRDVDQTDGTHIDDFVDNVVWSELAPGESEADREAYRGRLKSAVEASNEINIHFHTFEYDYFPDFVVAINRAHVLPFRLDLVDLVDRFPESCPNGFLAVMRVSRGGGRKFISSVFQYLRCRGNVTESVRKGTPRLKRCC